MIQTTSEGGSCDDDTNDDGGSGWATTMYKYSNKYFLPWTVLV